MSDPQTADRLAIMELYARYNMAVDSSDGAAFAATFVEDGAFIGSIHRIEGRQALHAFAETERLRQRGLQHWNANLVIDELDATGAKARAYMMAIVPVDGVIMVERAGSYADTLTKTSDGWRFVSRHFARLQPE